MLNVNGRFGIQYIIPYKLKNKDPYGIFRVMQEFTSERARENVLLHGGNFDGAVASEAGVAANPISMVLREYPDFAFTTFEEGVQTENVAEVSGNFGTIVNTNGVSIFDIATGIASVVSKVGKEANIPFGRLIFKATAVANELDIYLVGTPQGEGAFLSDSGLVAEAVIIPDTGGMVDVDELGITINGGSGTIAFVVGDIAALDVRGVNNGSVITSVGANPQTKYMGILAVKPKLADGSLEYIDFHKVSVPSGIPFSAISREFAEYTLTGEILIDPCNGGNLYTQYKMKADVICS